MRRPGPPGWGSPSADHVVPQGNAAYGQAPFGRGFDAGPPAKNRKPLLITAGATVAVLVVIGLVVGFLLRTDSGKSTGPTDAPGVAKAYLEALARGDARAALDLSAVQPASTELLTDEVLKKQIEKLPITDIEILDETQSDDGTAAVVRFGVKLGDSRTKNKLTLVAKDGGWKLREAFVDVATNGANANSTAESSDSGLLIFGRPVDESGHFYVFPGYLDATATTPYMTVNTVSELSFDRLGGEQSVKFWYAMTDAGRAAAEQAMRDYLTTCLSPGPKTGKCLDLMEDWGPEYDLATTTLTGPVEVGKLSYDFNDTLGRATVFGTTPPISFTVRMSDGQVHPQTMDMVLYEMVDLSKDPPVVERAN